MSTEFRDLAPWRVEIPSASRFRQQGRTLAVVLVATWVDTEEATGSIPVPPISSEAQCPRSLFRMGTIPGTVLPEQETRSPSGRPGLDGSITPYPASSRASSPARNASRCFTPMSRRLPALTDRSRLVRIRSLTSSRLIPSAAAASSGL